MNVQDNIETILRPGQLVGNQYRVERLIAKGGMAAVWAGTNEKTGKRIALKVILQSFTSNRDAVELFRREALTASKINHPNVVNIFDVIDHEGMTCIVMELFDGETLASYLTRNGPISLEKTLTLLLPAMRGVAAANAQGVVHRDLKPANIFLCSSSEGELITTKVLDFGISVIMRRGGENSPATGRIAMFGTPAYMAPEAIEMSADIDGRADVYGFGVLFFEALTGKLPFPGAPGMELFKHILTDPAPKVSLYRSDLPIDVVNLIDRALAKNRDDRFSDMQHLVRAAEDRLLPLLSSPRSLTPLMGISTLPPAGSTTNTSVPVVQAPFEEEHSGLRHRAETRALYSLAGESSHLAMPPKQIPTPNPRRPRNQRAAINTAIAVFLLVTAWVAIPAASNDRGGESSQLAHEPAIPPQLQRPQVIPLPSPLTPATENTVPTVATVPTETIEVVEVRVNETRTWVRPAASRSVKHRYHTESRSRERRSAGVADRATPSRAGRLSPSDF